MHLRILLGIAVFLIITFGFKKLRQVDVFTAGGNFASNHTLQKQPNILFVIMDDWSWPHAGAYGDKVVKTPAFDRIARMGILFTNAYCVSPSCTPSRGSILTGQTIHRLEEGGNLWSILPKKFKVYPDVLEEAGYQVGYTGKAWDPGILTGSGRSRNPGGPAFSQIKLKPLAPGIYNEDYAANFEAFFKDKPQGKPFCFWYGSLEPHRPYKRGLGLEQGKNPDLVKVPAYLPDDSTIRNDFLDYYAEIEYADNHLSKIIAILEKAGELDNTLIMMTGDNGMPFPRSKANLYDAGTRLPLAVCWPAKIKGGQVNHSFISFADFAPTIVEAVGLKPWPEMTGISFLNLLQGKKNTHRNEIFLERERHSLSRKDGQGYPTRAIRTKEYLYIRNIKHDRWPVGDPEGFADMDKSPSQTYILDKRNEKKMQFYFKLAYAKRPPEELYDLRSDSAQLVNVAHLPKYVTAKHILKTRLENWMWQTADPRANNQEAPFDSYPYYTGKDRNKESNP